MPDLFSVYQFFPNEVSERVRDFVPADEAVEAAIHYSTSLGARLGTTIRVIITTSGDECCWEWEREKGITFPPEHQGKLKLGVR